MLMDKENFKKAFTSFAEDDFETSREILSKELDSTINDYFKKELELENDVLKIEKQPEE
jgi:hypothetical protein